MKARFDQVAQSSRQVVVLECPEEKGVFVLDFESEDRGLLDEAESRFGIRSGEESSPPGAVALLELRVEEEGGERMLAAVVA
ncbi:MAG TPA: hypothetical protein VMN36_04320 [Verrucomicrobiales bacterium]|nr:hypothetical protein [Verrucomicrobiales bacterium]